MSGNGSSDLGTLQVLHAESNFVVARHPGRRFPGVLIQGDTLSIRRSEVADALDFLRMGNLAGAREELEDLLATFDRWLTSYEHVLASNGYEIPYPKRR